MTDEQVAEFFRRLGNERVTTVVVPMAAGGEYGVWVRDAWGPEGSMAAWRVLGLRPAALPPGEVVPDVVVEGGVG